jgi:hypothetical protein
VMATAVAAGLRPADAFNLVKAAASGLGTWQNPEVDVYHALTSSGYSAQNARTIAHQLTGNWVDTKGNAVVGPPSPTVKR